MKLVGLSRQIALTMMAMAFGVTLLVVRLLMRFTTSGRHTGPSSSQNPPLSPLARNGSGC